MIFINIFYTNICIFNVHISLFWHIISFNKFENNFIIIYIITVDIITDINITMLFFLLLLLSLMIKFLISQSGQHLYKQWTDVRLRIHNVTSKDSGLYTFRVTSKSKKKSDSQQLFVYVAKKEDDGAKKHRKKKSSKVHNITKRKTDLKGKIED